MYSNMKTVMKRLLLLYTCATCITVLIIREFGHGLSPRVFGVMLLTLCIAIGSTAVFVIKKSAKRPALQPGPPGNPYRHGRS